MKIRVAGIVNDSIVDGLGLRMTIFTQGCTCMCKGCHNPHTWDINGGYEITNKEILGIIDKNPLLDGITLSGGEPLLQADKLVFLAKEVKRRGLTVILYTGYVFEEIRETYVKLLENVWLTVDGAFIESKKTLDKPFVGSSNQRVIDTQISLIQGKVKEYKND